MGQPANFRRVKRPKVEVADILRHHLGDYLQKYKMPSEHYKVVYDMLNCRTAYLGGHVEKCDQCASQRIMYNSCRNRHCPKCQIITKERWLAARQSELLPVNYFHSVFTLPHDLNPLILCNKSVMLGLLFKAVSQTLMQFGQNQDNGLGGKLGIIAILHTWAQSLKDHFHLHCLVPGGALVCKDQKWQHCQRRFLFPVKALSKVFRGKYLTFMQEAFENNLLQFPGNTQALGTAKGFKGLIKVLRSKSWVVYTKEPIERPEWVLDYLARYTHRIAISNHRICALSNGHVTFTVKNRKDNTTGKVTLEAAEFIRRFLLHVLPKRFMRIRHYGFFANRSKKKSIAICRKLMGLKSGLPEVAKQSVQQIMLSLAGIDLSKCPNCRAGTMKKILKIPEGTGRSAFKTIWCANSRNGP